MKSFGRVIRLAISYRATFILSILCALGVAVLWGGNITAVYPLVEVVLDGKSAPAWNADQIAKAEASVKTLQDNVTRLESASDDDAAKNEANAAALTRARARLSAEQTALARHRRFQPYLEKYAPTDAFQTLGVVCALLFIGTVVKSIFKVLGQILVSRLSHLTTFELRKEFYRRTLRLDLAEFNEKRHGDLVARFTTDLAYVNSGVQNLIGQAVLEPLKGLACLAGAAFISWRLLLITFVVAPIAGYAIARLAKLLKRANRKALNELSGIYDQLGESFSAMRIIKAFTMESQQRQRFHAASKEYYKRSMKIARYDALVGPVTELMGMGMIALAILAGGYLAIEQQTHLFGFLKISDRPLDRGSLMLFYAMLAGASDPARRLSGIFSRLQLAAAASDRVYELLDREPTISDAENPTRMPKLKHALRFESVAFAYDAETPVLRGIDLTIAAGETVALVGPNGCGKSTLAGLAPRFFDPDAGRVTIDGVNLRDVRLRDLRRKIGVVTQEAMLLNDTIAENIRYAKPTATDEEVIAAAKKAHAHDFITNKLDEGYATIVGPGGGRLSGGQRQRIALARAILRDPQILILDEATSQIDVESERLIHDALAEFKRGRTTLLITHRPSTLDLADRIVVLDHGRIVDAGTREQLLGRCELFRKLCQTPMRESA